MSDQILDGTWLPFRAELSGEMAPEMALQKMELRLHDGQYSVSFGGEVSDSGTYHSTPGTPHGTLTIKGKKGPNEGKTLPSIFQIKGDLLRICYGLNRVAPVDFKAPVNSGFFLVSYRRKPS